MNLGFLVYFLIFFSPTIYAANEVISKECRPEGRIVSPSEVKQFSIWAEMTKVTRYDDRLEAEVDFVRAKGNDKDGPQKVKLMMSLKKCLPSLDVGQFYRLESSQTGLPFYYRLTTTSKISAKSKKFPQFEPELKACNGFPHSEALKNADFYVKGKVLNKKSYLNDLVEEITFEVNQSFRGSLHGKINIISKKDHSCSEIFNVGNRYELILHSLPNKYFYYDCCEVISVYD